MIKLIARLSKNWAVTKFIINIIHNGALQPKHTIKQRTRLILYTLVIGLRTGGRFFHSTNIEYIILSRFLTQHCDIAYLLQSLKSSFNETRRIKRKEQLIPSANINILNRFKCQYLLPLLISQEKTLENGFNVCRTKK